MLPDIKKLEGIKMAEEIKQLIDMVAELKAAVDNKFKEIDNRFDEIDNRFDKMDKRFDDIETAIEELNDTQNKILNSLRLMEKDVKSNQMHIERLEENDLFI